jgi:ribosome-associated protein
MDFGDVVIHLFHEPLRELYDLDRLWAEAPRIPIVTEKTPSLVPADDAEPNPWPED